MFFGCVPRECAAQLVRVFPLQKYRDIRVICSNGFLLEQAISQTCDARIIGNDVGLLSSAVGTLAAGGSFDIRFTGELEFVEQKVGDARFRRKVAAVVVVSNMTRFCRRDVLQSLRIHYMNVFDRFLDKAEASLERFFATMRLSGFGICDFREHALAAAGTGAAVIGFPPNRTGYIKFVQGFMDKNIDWPRVSCDPWNNRHLSEFIDSLRSAGVPYCIGAGTRIDGIEPVASYSGINCHQYYMYSESCTSSLVRRSRRSRAFAYEPVVSSALHAGTKVVLVQVAAGDMHYVKTRHCAHETKHVDARVNILVFLDGRLAGAFGYREKRRGNVHGVLVQFGFALSTDRHLPRLVAALSTCESAVTYAARSMCVVGGMVRMTVRTNKPCLMKYCGVFRLEQRSPGRLDYVSNVRRQSPQEIYREWFGKFASRHARDPREASQPVAVA